MSYPKSGNTWFRFILSNLLRQSAEENIDFHSACRYVPDIEVHHPELEALQRPRFIKSHCPRLIEAYPRVIYLVRDPRDVYVSYFYYLRKKLPAGMTLSQFVETKPHTVGLWSEHVSQWSRHPNLLTLRYEDLLQDPRAATLQALDFCELGGVYSDSWIKDAIERSSFQSMRQAEQDGGLPTRNGIQPSVAERFVRKGIAGDWRAELCGQSVELIETTEGEQMRRFGYFKDEQAPR
ncbi:MAG: sulfotransferase domain-containing protein [Pirellulales bacterium]|nr:sulfotransferase domain-containing protein [Pirellulales bacterium]